MTASNNGVSIDSSKPMLYLSYTLLLHRDGEPIDEDRTVTSDSAHQPLEFVDYLSGALQPYQDVRVVLTTAWVRTVGEKRPASLLPEPLRERVVGTTLRFPPRFGELRNGTGSTGSIIRHVAAHGVRRWLAIGDDFRCAHADLRLHFLLARSETALERPRILAILHTWLADNATSVSRTSRHNK